MMKITVITTAVLLLNLIISPLSAQEDSPEKKGELEIGFGPNFYGPGQQMADLMEEHNFDVASSFFSRIEHPHFRAVGTTAHLSYQQNISLKSQLGLRIIYSHFNEVYGYSTEGGLLSIKLSSVSIVPLYSYELDGQIDLDVGPAFSINTGSDFTEYERKNKSSKFSMGLLSGLNLKIWKSRVTFGGLGAYYMLTMGNEIGPFPADNDHSLPKSKLNYSHLDVVFNFGFNL